VSRAVTLLGYAVVVAAMAALEVAARRRRGTATAGQAIGLLLRRSPLQLLTAAAWLWLGWHLFVRASHP
jgi:hypothetical protein